MKRGSLRDGPSGIPARRMEPAQNISPERNRAGEANREQRPANRSALFRAQPIREQEPKPQPKRAARAGDQGQFWQGNMQLSHDDPSLLKRALPRLLLHIQCRHVTNA
jgi:hypothetical protein